MSLLDCLFVGALLALPAAWVAWKPDRRIFGLALLATVALAAVQLATEGLYWQLIPGYLLLAALAVAARPGGRRPSGGTASLMGKLALTALALVAVAPWLLAWPVPPLVKPDGPYPVGTEIYRWVDLARPEEATEAPDDRRNVIVQAWYPADGTGGEPASPYIDGLGRLPPRVTLLPSGLMKHFGKIETHAATAVPVSGDKQLWPVVLFGPGYGAPRAFYTGLATALASRGYVVLTLDHPYESAVVELADGTIATTIERRLDNDPGMTRFMRGRLDLRVEDIRFVIDQLSRPDVMGPRLAGRLDLDRIASMGHSLGGAAAALSMDADDRIVAAVNIDGTLYGPISGAPVQRPFLLLDSDHSETGHSANNIANNALLLEHFGPGSLRYEIAHANHFGFTDAPMFLAPPARFAASLIIGGGLGPARTQRITVDVLDSFLSPSLKALSSDLPAIVARHRSVSGGPSD